MGPDSYTLREVAELLGVSKRTLQRRIQEGAFPGRFLAAGRHGLETRVPAEDVQRALDELRRRGQASWRPGGGVPPDLAQRAPRPETITPARELDSLLVPYQTPELSHPSSGAGPASALTHSDLESLRDAMLAIVREDREMFLSAVREALLVRDQEILNLKQELTATRRAVESVRSGLEGIERRISVGRGGEQTIDAQAWADLLGAGALGARGAIDVDSILREIGELESMLAATKDG